MANMTIKEIREFVERDENNNEIRKSKLIISDNGVDTEIVLEGNGRLKVAVLQS